MKGKFITLEGGEGTGKSTQAPRIASFLQSMGIAVHLTREPGGNPPAEQIRNLLVQGNVDRWTAQTEALLMMAARSEHWHKTIKPMLASEIWVISDRFWDSTRAYQGYGHNLSLATIDQIHFEFMPGAIPDRTYIFDLDPNIGIKRAFERDTEGETRFELMGIEYHQRVRKGFNEIATSESDRCKIINANQSRDLVLKEITTDLEKFEGAVYYERV